MSRQDVIAIALQYLQSGLVENDLQRVPLAPDCIRVENGWDTGKDRAEILRTMPRIPALGNLRWVVEAQEAVVFWDIVRPDGYKQISEYFRVSRGLLTDVRANSEAPHAKTNALGPAGKWAEFKLPPQRRDAAARSVLRACRGYLRALLRHDLSKAPLGADVTLTEHGRLVAHGAEAARKHLLAGTGSLRRLRELRWIIEGNEAALLYEAQMDADSFMVGTYYFRLYDGKLRELVTTYGAGPSPVEIGIFRRGEHLATAASRSTRPA